MKSPKRTKRGRKVSASETVPARESEEVRASEDVNKQAPAKDDAEDDVLAEGLARYEAGFNKDQRNQEEAYQDLKFIAGEDQWDPKAKQDRDNEDRPVLVANQCPQFVRQVTGDIRQMKPAIKVVPVDERGSKDVAAKILPGMIRYIEQRSDASGIYFQAADQQAGCGIGHWQVVHEREHVRTFNQELRIAPIPDGVAVVWDPDSVLPTREDAGYCFVPIDMARGAFDKAHPDASADPLEKSPECFTSWFSDDHVRVAVYWRKVPTTKRLALYQDGKIDDVTDDPEAERLAIAAGAEVEDREGTKVQRTLMTASSILDGPEDWPGPDIPVIPLIGEEIVIGRDTIRRGVIRVVKDVQRIYNYALSTQTEVVALQPKAPFIGTEKQFEKYVDQWETANTRNWPFLEYTPDGAAPPPQRANPPVASPGLNDLLNTARDNMNSSTGIYPASLGGKSNETSGKAIMARQREGDTGTYVYTDNFGRALRRTGQILVNLIPEIYDTKRLIRIVGEDGKIDHLDINKPQPGEDGAPIMLNDVTVGAYEVSIEMGPGYSTKREEAREGMIALMQAAGPEIAQLYMDLFVKMQDWPLADKIAKRAQMLLPPAIQQMEAAESGEDPPPQPPPPPPTPEQQQAMELEQAKHQENQQRNIELAHKNDLDEAKLALEKQKLVVEGARIENEHLRMELELETARMNHASATVKHAATVASAQTGAAAAADQHANSMEAHGADMASRAAEDERAAAAAAAEPGAAAAGPKGSKPTASARDPRVAELEQQVAALTDTVAAIMQELAGGGDPAAQGAAPPPGPEDVAPAMPDIQPPPPGDPAAGGDPLQAGPLPGDPSP